MATAVNAATSPAPHKREMPLWPMDDLLYKVGKTLLLKRNPAVSTLRTILRKSIYIVCLASIPRTGGQRPTSTVAVSLAWDPVQDPSVTGYYVHFGMQSPRLAGSCTYAQSAFCNLASLSNKLSPTVIVSGLASNTTYFFAVGAYNDGLESSYSAEVSTVTKSV